MEQFSLAKWSSSSSLTSASSKCLYHLEVRFRACFCMLHSAFTFENWIFGSSVTNHCWIRLRRWFACIRTIITALKVQLFKLALHMVCFEVHSLLLHFGLPASLICVHSHDQHCLQPWHYVWLIVLAFQAAACVCIFVSVCFLCCCLQSGAGVGLHQLWPKEDIKPTKKGVFWLVR